MPVCRNTSTVAQGPERGLLLMSEVAPGPVGQVDGVDPAGVSGLATLKVLTRPGEPVPGPQVASGGDEPFGVPVMLLDGAQQRGQQRQLGPGPLVHPGLDPRPGLLRRAFRGLDRARRYPRCPAGWIVGCPPGDVLVEGPDVDQFAAVVHPGSQRLPIGGPDVGESFLPGLRDLR